MKVYRVCPTIGCSVKCRLKGGVYVWVVIVWRVCPWPVWSLPPNTNDAAGAALVTIPRLAPGPRSTATKTGELTRTALVSGGMHDLVSDVWL